MSLRRADHLSRGVLQTVVRRCVWSRNLVNEEAMAHKEVLGQMKKMVQQLCAAVGQNCRKWTDLRAQNVKSKTRSNFEFIN